MFYLLAGALGVCLGWLLRGIFNPRLAVLEDEAFRLHLLLSDSSEKSESQLRTDVAMVKIRLEQILNI